MRLYEAGQISQTNEVRMRGMMDQAEELERLREAVNYYQRALARQQGATEYKKKQHARTAQSLTHESRCHQVTAQSLEHERTQVRDFIGFLDSLQLPKLKNSTKTSVGELWLERKNMKADLEHQAARTKYLEQALEQVQEELEHKHLLLKELSCNFEPEQKDSTSPRGMDEHENMRAGTMLLDSSGDEEVHTSLEKSSDKQKGDAVLLESSGEDKVAVPKSGKRQQRKRRHS